MSLLRQTLKRIPPVRWAYSQTMAAQRSVQSDPTVLRWQLDYKRWLSYLRFRAFHDRHAGERCFIVGNGPSLNDTDLSLLRNEKTFMLNRAYLLFPRLGFHPTYFVSINRFVLQQFGEEISQLPMPKFVSWHSRAHLPFTDNTLYLRTIKEVYFSPVPPHYVCEGATVTYVAMQIAFYMGFKQVILIGVDHNFASKGEAHKAIVSEGGDPNHFDPNYFGKGVTWQLPDLETSEIAYLRAKAHYEQAGREIIDATVGGKLQVYRRVDYNTLF